MAQAFTNVHVWPRSAVPQYDQTVALLQKAMDEYHRSGKSKTPGGINLVTRVAENPKDTIVPEHDLTNMGAGSIRAELEKVNQSVVEEAETPMAVEGETQDTPMVVEVTTPTDMVSDPLEILFALANENMLPSFTDIEGLEDERDVARQEHRSRLYEYVCTYLAMSSLRRIYDMLTNETTGPICKKFMRLVLQSDFCPEVAKWGGAVLLGLDIQHPDSADAIAKKTRAKSLFGKCRILTCEEFFVELTLLRDKHAKVNELRYAELVGTIAGTKVGKGKRSKGPKPYAAQEQGGQAFTLNAAAAVEAPVPANAIAVEAPVLAVPEVVTESSVRSKIDGTYSVKDRTYNSNVPVGILKTWYPILSMRRVNCDHGSSCICDLTDAAFQDKSRHIDVKYQKFWDCTSADGCPYGLYFHGCCLKELFHDCYLLFNRGNGKDWRCPWCVGTAALEIDVTKLAKQQLEA